MSVRVGLASLFALSLPSSAGCAASSGSPGQLPTWYSPANTTYPVSQFAVGRGACGSEVAPPERAACAVRRATEDAIFQLKAHVTAVQEQTCRLDATRVQQGGATSHEAQVACRSVDGSRSEASLDIENAVPREQACDAQYCYALIALSRAELAERVEQSIAPQRESFEQLLQRAPDTDLLSSLALLAQAEELAPPLDQASALLLVFDGPGAPQSSFGQRVLQAKRARLHGASVCLRASAGSEPSPERLFALASTMLSELGIDKVQLGVTCLPGALAIDYTPSSQALPVAQPSNSDQGLWTVRFAGTIRVCTPDGTLAREREVQGRGLSRSADSARRDAEDRLADAVREAIATAMGLTGQAS